jgi:4-hydroxybenzoyl-CoA reductase subunit beta
MRLPKFAYRRPADLQSAIGMLAERPGAKPLLGGTDLLVNMKHRVEEPPVLVDLSRLPELAGIRKEGEDTVIGAAATLKEIQRHADLRKAFPALVEAAMAVGSYRHQTMGTLGGNLCQNTRCRFFNQSWEWRQARPLCHKAGGEECHVVGRKSVCFSTYSGDLAPALLALDANVRLHGPGGEREVPLLELYSREGREPLALRPAEVVVAAVIPGSSAAGRSRYEKFSLRGAIDFPIVGAAVWRGDGEARVAYTAVDRGPVRARELEAALRGTNITDETMAGVAALAAKAAKVAPTTVQPVSFKRELMGSLFVKAFRAAA